MFYKNNNNKKNNFVDMTFEDYNQVVLEKDKIIENISNELDATKEKLNILEFKFKNLFDKYHFSGYQELCNFLYNYYIFQEKYFFKNFEELEMFVDIHKKKRENVEINVDNVNISNEDNTQNDLYECKNECCCDYVNTPNTYCSDCAPYVKICKSCGEEYSDKYSDCKNCFECRVSDDEEDDESEEEQVNFYNNLDILNNEEEDEKIISEEKENKKDSFINDKYNNMKETINGDIKENYKKEPDENISKNKESKNLLNKIKNNYYEFYSGFLPKISNVDIQENYNVINNSIINKKKINTEIIIQYSNVYEKFINSNNKINNKIFSEYIEYNKDNYNIKYYEINKFYGKVKKCYDFILFFKNKGFNENIIMDVLYKSDISYTKLYKIKKLDYQELKSFFLDILNSKKEPEDENNFN